MPMRWDCLNCGHQQSYCSSDGEPRWNDIYRGKPKNSKKNLFPCHFVNHKSHMDCSGPNTDLRCERPATNRLSRDTAVPMNIITIIKSGSAVLVRTLAVSHRRFRNLYRRLVGLRWTGDQPVAETSACTGQHNTEIQRNIHAPNGIQTRNPSNQAAKTYALDRAATGTGYLILDNLQ
jgi:hypothetical protein